MVVKNGEFSFNFYIYKQIDGVAMGSPLGSILANIFVGYFEPMLFYKFPISKDHIVLLLNTTQLLPFIKY